MHAYLLALEIEPIDINKVYVALPLHCTVMPWFYTDHSPADVLRAITSIVQSHAPIKLESGAEAFFGHEKDVPVNLIAEPDEVVALHKKLLEAIIPLGANVDSEWIGEGYSPHVTRQRSGRFETGQTFVTSKLYFAEAVNPDEIFQKKIVAKLSFGRRVA
jgi:2'-5' RNA ligase